MTPFIPDDQLQFAQLAVKQKYIQPEQVRSALELYRRYQASSSDVPTIARILVGKGWLDRQKGEMLLRHLHRGEALPSTPAPAPAQAPSGLPRATPGQLRPSPAGGNAGFGLDAADFEILDDLGLEPAGSAIDLAVGTGKNAPVDDEKQLMMKGMGARVVKSRDLVKGYRILDVLGEGSMGIMYCAHQISMDRTVALKVLPEDRTKDQAFVEEFLAEARNAGRLNHPNLIRVHEVAKSGETYYYSMEYVEGHRLDEMMDECEGGRLDPKLAVNVFVQVSAALDYGFRAGVIHREIRPNSIMVNDDGQSKLADLGLTKDEHTRFLDGENAYYVAPEQAKRADVDTRSDIYSMGCCLYHCLTGERPFEGGLPKDVLRRRLTTQPPNPRDLNPSLSPELAKVVMKMMAQEPTQRYQTPSEVSDALKKIPFAAPAAAKKPLGKALGGKHPMRPGASGSKPRPPMPSRPGMPQKKKFPGR